jgi:hypothetical protein
MTGYTEVVVGLQFGVVTKVLWEIGDAVSMLEAD